MTLRAEPGRAGELVVPGFLDPTECAALRAAVVTGSARLRVGVATDDGRVGLDERVRRGVEVRAAPDAAALVAHRLVSASALGDWYQAPLGPLQAPRFLAYERGDFFGPHVDTGAAAALSRAVRARRLSVIVFLTGQSRRPAPDCHGGGELVLFSTRPGTSRPGGTWVEGQPGLLVAFAADRFHQVRPVLHGQRLTIAAWFERTV